LELASFDVASGRKLWSVAGLGAMPVSSPAAYGRRLLVATSLLPPFEALATQMGGDRNGDGKLSPDEFPDPAFRQVVLEIDKRAGDGDGTIDAKEWNGALRLENPSNTLLALNGSAEEWRRSKGTPDVPSPLLYRDTVYQVRDGGILVSLRTTDGSLVKEGRLTGAVDKYFASPVASDGKVFTCSESGKVSSIRARADWALLAVNDLGEECYATPAIAGGLLYVRTRSTIWAFGAPPAGRGLE
jgi:hypothetical protein